MITESGKITGTDAMLTSEIAKVLEDKYDAYVNQEIMHMDITYLVRSNADGHLMAVLHTIYFHPDVSGGIYSFIDLDGCWTFDDLGLDFKRTE